MSTERPIEARWACAKFRAWHRGTREADYIIGGFFDRYFREWGDEETRWFEALLEFDDVEIMAWALGKEKPPSHMQGALMEKMRRLDYVEI